MPRAALLLAVDSWGGVASMITLAEALRGQGLNARIAAFCDFGDKVRVARCEFVDLGVSSAGVWDEQYTQRPGWARSLLRTWAVLRAPTLAVRACPWISRPQEPGAHGRIADGGGPE